jgi:protein-export membrane protein SecD
LAVYALINIMVFKMVPVTMSLAGIAGFIISIGSAVDTNILTFERLKEELRMGKALPVAIKESFRRSWTSIRDSHVAGIISSVIIFSFGSGGVRGFALVLLIGILLSLFTAITVTRNWMLLLAGSRFARLMQITK